MDAADRMVIEAICETFDFMAGYQGPSPEAIFEAMEHRHHGNAEMRQTMVDLICTCRPAVAAGQLSVDDLVSIISQNQDRMGTEFPYLMGDGTRAACLCCLTAAGLLGAEELHKLLLE